MAIAIRYYKPKKENDEPKYVLKDPDKALLDILIWRTKERMLRWHLLHFRENIYSGTSKAIYEAKVGPFWNRIKISLGCAFVGNRKGYFLQIDDEERYVDKELLEELYEHILSQVEEREKKKELMVSQKLLKLLGR